MEIAQRDLQIAQLTAELHEMQTDIRLYETALGITAQREADKKAVAQAEEKTTLAQSPLASSAEKGKK